MCLSKCDKKRLEDSCGVRAVQDIGHGAYVGTLGLMERKKYVLYVIRKR